MTPELIAAIIALLGALTALIKSRIDVQSVKSDRAETKVARDRDSQDLHDKVIKLDFQCGANKDMLLEQKNRIDDVMQQICTLNRQLAEVLVKMDHVIDGLHELKEARHD